jgi:hypothetical protein
MSINGNGDTLTIKGAKLKVSGGVQVSGSIAYTEDATGFGGVAAQIDTNNTLNITAGKTSGVAKIERSAAASITAVDHTNVSNNTTIHIALKNTSTVKGNFVTIGTFADDGTVKVNYTDEYVIGPGETGMITVRKVAGILSMYIREMFTSSTTDTTSKPFYIKDGTNYKYPLYTTSGGNLDITPVAINGVSYYQPSGGYTTKTRPPLGIPELIVTPSGNLAIGNNGNLTTVNYDVWGVPSSFDFGSIYQGTTKKTSFILENGEFSGSFTESGASSGDAYSLYVDKTDVSVSDTVNVDLSGFVGTITFHHDTFANSGDPYGDGTLVGATANAHVFADTQTGTYTWGTLSGNTLSSTNTTYTWTPPNDISGADVLMVAGGGGGGGVIGGGGGAGGLLHHTNQSLSGQKTIVIGNGGTGGIGFNNGISELGSDGNDTTFTDLTTVYGGGGGGANGSTAGNDGGSGGGGGYSGAAGSGIPGQGNIGGYYGSNGSDTAGGGGGAGGPGGNPTTSVSGNGGTGIDKSSVFGTTYGDSGWFASGGAGGARTGSTAGTASQGGGTAGTDSTTAATDAQKHTGGGGGGAGYSGSSTSELGGRGGSGIVLIKSIGIGKTIPKVTGATFDSTNVTFTVQGSSEITNIKYTINGGSEQTTPVGTLAVAHNLSVSASITVVAYAVDANGNQISTKKTVTGTIPTIVWPTSILSSNSTFPSNRAWGDSLYYTLDTGTETDTFKDYILHDGSTTFGSTYNITFTESGGTWTLDVVTNKGDEPHYVAINQSSSSAYTATTTVNVSRNDAVFLYGNNGGYLFDFPVNWL